MTKPRYDMLGLGCTAVDDLLYVDSYPAPDSKIRIRRRERQCGGLTATALVAAARLGGRCAYAGTLGRDADSFFVKETLRREGVSVRHVLHQAESRPVRSVIVVDERRATRTIFYDTHGVVGAPPGGLSPRLLRQTRVLFVDRFGMNGMIQAASLARTLGIPVVADFETTDTPHLSQLMKLVDHLVVSRDFALRLTGTRHPARAVTALLNQGHQAVVVTAGEQGCWYAESLQPKPHHLPAFQVRTVDTTGCGDVFHGAYALALAQESPLEERVGFAAAAAALKAAHPGGQHGIPNRPAVDAFLKRHHR